LGWGAAWLYRATNLSLYKKEFERHWLKFKLDKIPSEFSWNDKTAGLQVLMAKLTNETQYKRSTEEFCEWVTKQAPMTKKGMVYLDKWGSLRHASYVAFICLQV